MRREELIDLVAKLGTEREQLRGTLSNALEDNEGLKARLEDAQARNERLKTERLEINKALGLPRDTEANIERVKVALLLRAELHAIRNQSLTWAMTCHHECPECDAMYDLIRAGWFPTEIPHGRAVEGDI